MIVNCRRAVTVTTITLLYFHRYSAAFSVSPAKAVFQGVHHVDARTGALSFCCRSSTFHSECPLRHVEPATSTNNVLKRPANNNGRNHRGSACINKLFMASGDSNLDPKTRLVSLQTENEILKGTIAELEDENKRLEQQRRRREIVIIESFEGEGRKMFDEYGDEIDPWWDDDDSSDDDDDLDIDIVVDADIAAPSANTTPDMMKNLIQDNADVITTSPITPTTLLQQKLKQQQRERRKGRKREKEQSARQQSLDSSCGEGDDFDELTCPTEPDVSFKDALKTRAYWLCGLLALQSLSGFILAENEELLHSHPVVVYFLTMLVGAGGNAGNQASVRVIRGLALGTLNEKTQRQFLSREFKMAISLSFILSITGFVRAFVFKTPFAEAFAITSALSMIVFTSICLGAILPLLLKKMGVDPAHSSTSIQVIMDILGVVLTLLVITFILDSEWGKALISKISFVAA